MKDYYKKEYFTSIVLSSFTIREISDKLGLKKSGGSSSTIGKYIKLYDIDTSHFRLDYSHNSNRLPINEVLIENSSYKSTNHLKQRLYKEGIKKPICELCGQDEWWHGKKMSLILDHINGNNTDNRLENLRIVCPNCEGTLDTHCVGNKLKHNTYIHTIKKEFYCSNCGKQLTYRNKHMLCDDCYKKSTRKVNRPELSILLSDVKNLGYKGTGRKYNVSDNSIRKWIKNADIV